MIGALLGGRLAGSWGGRSRHENDASVAADLNWSNAPADGSLPTGLELQWVGTAGFRIAFEGTELWIDPFFTRPGMRRVLGRGAVLPDETLLSRYVQRADAVLVGHTHFDHAMDVPWISARTGCRVYGSASLSTLMGLHGLAERAVAVEVHKPFEIGPFTVTFVPSVHSKLLLGLKIPSDGEFTCDCLDDLGAGAYRCGPVYGIHLAVGGATLYHQGSANLLDDEIRHRGVDVFLCGIAGRVFTRRYVERILRRLEPRIVVPHHHDDFFRPLDAPMGFSFNVNFGGFAEEVAAVSRDFRVRSLAPLQTIRA